MKRASQHFDDASRKRINDAVAAAEASTSAEIVPVVATASGRYDRAEDVAGLWLGAALVIGAWVWSPVEPTSAGDWGAWPQGWNLALILVALVIGFIAGALIAQRAAWLRRLFTPAAQRRDEVAAKARAAFFDSSVHHTGGGTGLLIYISLFERGAAVLADQAILEAVGQPAIDELCTNLTAALHEGDLTDALESAVRSAGELLAGPLPRSEDDRNELNDELLVID